MVRGSTPANGVCGAIDHIKRDRLGRQPLRPGEQRSGRHLRQVGVLLRRHLAQLVTALPQVVPHPQPLAMALRQNASALLTNHRDTVVPVSLKS